MPTHKTKTDNHGPLPLANVSAMMNSPAESLSESVFVLSLLACLRVFCDERGWTHTGYFLEKAQESLLEVDQS